MPRAGSRGAVPGIVHDRSASGQTLFVEPETVVSKNNRLRELAAAEREEVLRILRELGALMDENHEIQRSLGGSGEANERLLRAARKAGALGAKLAGAGQGGTVVALWPDADPAPLEAALRQAGAAALHRPAPCEGVRLA